MAMIPYRYDFNEHTEIARISLPETPEMTALFESKDRDKVLFERNKIRIYLDHTHVVGKKEYLLTVHDGNEETFQDQAVALALKGLEKTLKTLPLSTLKKAEPAIEPAKHTDEETIALATKRASEAINKAIKYLVKTELKCKAAAHGQP